MQKISFFLFSFIVSSVLLAQNELVVMDVAGEPVSKDEFLQIYLKNNLSYLAILQTLEI